MKMSERLNRLNDFMDRLISLNKQDVRVEKEIKQCMLEIKKELGISNKIYISVDTKANYIINNKVVFTEELAKEIKKQLDNFEIRNL
jgi:hypothetical protein